MNFYREAAKILDDLSTKKHGSLKSIVFDNKSSRTTGQQKRLYALLSETLKNKDALDRVLESSELLKIEKKVFHSIKIPRSLALVLLHDFLCSKQGIAAANGPIKEAILRHKTRLKSEYVKAQVLSKTIVKDFVPRWVRVNTLRTTFEQFLERLKETKLIPVSDLEALKSNQNGYLIDPNIPSLLAFHPSYPVTTTFAEEYSSGTIILQDKASCIPACLLAPENGGAALDACAAPGNKTTQIAAAVGPKGKVIAVEKDTKRVETLRSMVEKAGASKFTTILNSDFTLLDPNDEQFSDVTHILLDPSCSGSGLLDRLDYDSSQADLSIRLRGLCTFQTRLLNHALSFPSAQRVVYSTCSHHAEENERVVKAVLEQTSGWQVLKREEQPEGLRIWGRRGFAEECSSPEIAEACIRCEKGTDATIGFFAVAFTRITELVEDEDEEWQGIPDNV